MRLLRPLVTVLALAALPMLPGCAAECGPETCVGCCDASGVCHAPEPNNCGLAGAACQTCVPLQICVAGACQFSGGVTSSTTTASSTTASSTATGSTTTGSTASTSTGSTATGSTATGSTSGATTGASTTGSSGGTLGTTSSTGGTTSTGTTGSDTTGSTSSTATGSTTGSTGSTATSSTATGSTTTGSSASTGTLGTTSGSTGSTGTIGSSTGSTGLGGNDDCAGAVTLSEGATIQGNTRGANVTYTLAADTCAFIALVGPDLFYSFTAQRPGYFEFTVQQDPSSPTFDPAVYLLDPTCPTPGSGGRIPGCLTGDDTGAANSVNQVRKLMNTGEQVLVVVGSYSLNNPGPFLLSAQFVGTPSAVDTCSSPGTLVEGQAMSGSTRNAGEDFEAPSSSCGFVDSLGPDVVYAFSPRATGIYEFRATASRPDSGFLPSVYVGTSPCGGDGGSISCLPLVSSTSQGVRHNLSQGSTYFVYVDGEGPAGEFSLTANPFTPPPADVCATATPLLLGQSTLGDTSLLANDYSPGTTCNSLGSLAPEAVHVFTPPTTEGYRIWTSTDGGFGYVAPLYVATACPSSGALVSACFGDLDGTSNTFVGELTANTPYFVFVEGSSVATGPYAVQVERFTLAPAPANDTCATAETLPLSTTVSGSWATARSQYQVGTTAPTNCTTFRGTDLFYSFTAQTTGTFIFTLTAPDDDGVIIVMPTGACPAPGALTSCRASADNEVGDPEVLSIGLTAGETITLLVSPYSGSSPGGAFSLSVVPQTTP